VTPRFWLTTLSITFLLQIPGLVNTSSSVLPLNPLGSVQAAAAEDSVYKPPIRPRPTSRTNGTGSRGCSNSQPISLNLLVPGDHMGQTASDHPTFFWYVKNASKDNISARFTLVEPGIPKPVFDQTIPITSSGIMRLELPRESPGISPDKEYRWTVSVLCNPDRPSDFISFAQSFIVQNSPSEDLAKQLAAAKSDLERAQIYANSGYWYDALADYSKASGTDLNAQKQMFTLLEQVGLKDVVEQASTSPKTANSQ
jgi:hypothetical protein